MNENESSNFDTFRDCLTTPLIQKSVEKPSPTKVRKNRILRNATERNTRATKLVEVKEAPNDIEELAEFIDYIASEIFTSLPETLRTLTYSAWYNSASLQSQYPEDFPKDKAHSILNSLPPNIEESLTTYNLLPPLKTLTEFLTPVLMEYVSKVTNAPPPASVTRELATECEICERSWVPLTYHHLIPREVHAKVLKRGWHTEDHLMDAAWICRACHSFVHKVATNEELAREYFTVERLLDREDVRSFAGWIGKVRWKAR
ncbi:hypothetical protein B0O99DRAFT_633668 [Bisporella sp. PMI_857]|nr:hypothetical protein B0O99DRAFT_633668 [Bisporella sp. PMI_857]